MYGCMQSAAASGESCFEGDVGSPQENGRYMVAGRKIEVRERIERKARKWIRRMKLDEVERVVVCGMVRGK